MTLVSIFTSLKLMGGKLTLAELGKESVASLENTVGLTGIKRLRGLTFRIGVLST